MRNILVEIILIANITVFVQCLKKRPHIIFILVDDLGWTDVSYHGSKQIPTPNIDAMAYAGITLGNYYTQPICTPTRSAILTGRHPIHLGMQHFVIRGPEPWGLGLEEKLLPQYLKELGYATHLVGKWHLGFYRKEYTPTYRGFDTFYGLYGGQGDYWDHQYSSTFLGLDWHRNSEPVRNETNHYSTLLLTQEAQTIIQDHNQSQPMFLYLAYNAPHRGNIWNPREAPQEFLRKLPHIKERRRREYAASLTYLDFSLGNLITTLHETGILKDSIIIFSTDNGGQSADAKGSAGCNLPLRGTKGTFWEGGMRGVGFVWSPFLKKMEYTSHHMFEVSDWLPTLLSAAGYDKRNLPKNIDGFNQWESLSENGPDVRGEILHSIDPVEGSWAIRRDDMKLIYTPLGSLSLLGSTFFGPNSAIMDLRPNYTVSDLKGEAKSSQFESNLYKIFQQYRSGEKRIRREPHVLNCGEVPLDVMTNCVPSESPCLFNITADPCEYKNLAATLPETVAELTALLAKYNSSAVPIRNRIADPESDPAIGDGSWKPWMIAEPDY